MIFLQRNHCTALALASHNHDEMLMPPAVTCKLSIRGRNCKSREAPHRNGIYNMSAASQMSTD